MKRVFGLALLALSVGLFSACGNCSQNVKELEDNSWHLKGKSENSYMISFVTKDSTINGVGDCNRFFGKYEVKGDKLSIKMGGSTMMMCPNMDGEQSFFTMLSKVDSYKIKDSTLTLYADKKECGEFVISKEVKADSHTAENSLDYQGEYKGTFPAADCPGINITLKLNSDNTYNMQSEYIDRNSKFDEKGTYTVTDNLLTLSDGENDQYYKVEENRLVRLDANKEPITGELASMYILKK